MIKSKTINLTNGKRIDLYDDIFTFGERLVLYDTFRNCPFFMRGTDDSIIDHQSDITMVHEVTQDFLNNTRFLKVLSGEPEFNELITKYKVNSAIVNVTTPADKYHKHVDIVGGKTLLYYVNMDWNPSFFGETVFVGDRDDDYQFVAPYVPGRIVVFDGEIPHIIRPQIMSGPKYRMTFAIKFVLAV